MLPYELYFEGYITPKEAGLLAPVTSGRLLGNP
ncbi:hypothetical protein VINI7043_29010 [Vibrio nigripulchritudo ATCC 27043]|nr:hypothetical protein VINI7043_29010 [Vibrio nigripulchritudo ATCC 27043]